MIVLVLLFLGCYINPSLSDYYNNINTIQTADDPHHTTKDLFELTHTLFQNINSYSGLINLESVPRIFKTNTNLVQTLASSQTVVHVITLMTAQASVSPLPVLQTRISFTGTSHYFSWFSTPSAGSSHPCSGAPSGEATSPGTLRSETLSTTAFSVKTSP